MISNAANAALQLTALLSVDIQRESLQRIQEGGYFHGFTV